jgi:hypothetical protein
MVAVGKVTTKVCADLRIAASLALGLLLFMLWQRAQTMGRPR